MLLLRAWENGKSAHPGGTLAAGGPLLLAVLASTLGEKKNINANTGDQGPMVIPGRNVWTPSTVFEPVWGQKDR